MADIIAFDRSSVRSIDKDGRLHIASAHISKAAVNEYKGSEIPNAEELGLESNRLYRLFRDPEELRKAASTFNNLPILSKHVAVSAEKPRQDLIIGTTGSDTTFKDPYLDASLAFWVGDAIQKIVDDEERQLSCAYHYVPVLETGDYHGQTYDLRMTQIKGNHVALVKEGRAGADVIVGDEKPKVDILIHLEPRTMPKPSQALSRKAHIVRGALRAVMPQMLAADAKIDLLPIVAGVTASNYKTSKAVIVRRLEAATKGKLAKDANLKDVHGLLDRLDGEGEEDATKDEEQPMKPEIGLMPGETDVDPNQSVDNPALDDDGCEKVCSMLEAEGVSPEIIAKVRASMAKPDATDAEADPMMPPAEGDDPAAKPDPKKAMMRKIAPDRMRGARDVEPGTNGMVAKGAMDAAIAKAQAETRKMMREIAEAETFVRGLVGQVKLAEDSAEAVYGKGLDLLKIKRVGVHPSAYRSMLELYKETRGRDKPRVAQDAKPGQDANLQAAFPNMSRLKVA